MAEDVEIVQPVPHGPLNLLRAALRVVQLAGVTAATGFMFIYGRESFLGVRAPHTVTELGFAMGEFCVGTFLVLLRHINVLLIWLVLIVLAISIVVAKARLPRKFSWITRTGVMYAALLVSTISALGVLIYVELPIANLNDALLTNISDYCDSPSKSGLESRSCRFWEYLKGAHPVQGSDVDRVHLKNRSINTLEQYYVASLLLTTLLWWFLYYAHFASDYVIETVKTVTMVALVCCTILLPYTFGKLFGWDWTPNITVLAKAATDKAPQWIAGYLLDSSDTSIFVISFESGVTSLKELPRINILESDTSSNDDVLAKRLALASPKPPPTTR